MIKRMEIAALIPYHNVRVLCALTKKRMDKINFNLKNYENIRIAESFLSGRRTVRGFVSLQKMRNHYLC